METIYTTDNYQLTVPDKLLAVRKCFVLREGVLDGCGVLSQL